jgi:DNA mismatch endonuclease, patch repair protein
MTHIWPSQVRSQVMARIRGSDSGPELILRRYLREANISYSTYANLPGTPDIILKSSKLAIFVHGCFWHGCRHHYRRPHSNVEYWSAKLQRNRARDRENAKKLRALKWRIAVVWECQLSRNPRLVVKRLLKRLEKEHSHGVS